MNPNYPSYEEQQKIIGEFTLMDDIFMKAVFNTNLLLKSNAKCYL